MDFECDIGFIKTDEGSCMKLDTVEDDKKPKGGLTDE